MKFDRIAIRGFGRLKDLNLEFAPGLQVLIGPNERGKSTIRAFVADMLYGQKRRTDKRIFEESNALRNPWEKDGSYGGSLFYSLDNGTRIEVSREFSKKGESIQVYDHTQAKDITATFSKLRNKEVDFASRHLGVSKSVFLGTATISHVSLEALGDNDALDEIRDKILSLADSGEESRSANDTLKRLEQRIAAIGRQAARTKPLPAAKARLDALEAERRDLVALLDELAGADESRRALREDCEGLREERRGIEAWIRLHELHEMAEALRQADSLKERIDMATQHCFALSAVREFPLDKTSEVQRAESGVENARRQCERIEAEVSEIQAQIEAGGTGDSDVAEDIPEELEARFDELSAHHQSLRARLSEAEVAVESAEARLEEAQATLQQLPDFGRVAPDPVEWLTQLATSFSVALASRREECELRDRLRDEAADREERIAPGRKLFAEMDNFPELARAYVLEQRAHDAKATEREQMLRSFGATRHELAEDMPGLLMLSICCLVVMGGLLGWYFYQQNVAFLYPVAMIALCTLFFGGRWFWARGKLQRLDAQIDSLEVDDRAAVDREHAAELHPIEDLLENAACESVRELEALHDEYRSGLADLEARGEMLEEQEARAAEAEERIPLLLARYRETFARVNESIEDERDVAEAAGRAIARYQEYRETKRVLSASRSASEKAQAGFKALREELAACQETLIEAEQEMRQVMRDNGFKDERNHESTSAALRAYRAQLISRREASSRRGVLEEKRESLHAAAAAERKNLQAAEKALAALLKSGGAESVEEWDKLAEQAKEYQELWTRRSNLEEQRKAVMRDRNPEEMRAALEPHLPLAAKPKAARQELAAAVEKLSGRIDALDKEEHALHVEQAQRGAGRRSLSEIDEEIAQVTRTIEALDLEFESASYAMALIEEIARDKHARIAPGLATSASGYLSAITRGAYSELLLSRDMTLSVRIPQTNRMNESPERSLSKGTVDQIYLALRLALVERLADEGERVPMLLDDPFANYDDSRLEAALELIAEIANNNQILLFTCREDVVRAAEARDTRIIRL